MTGETTSMSWPMRREVNAVTSASSHQCGDAAADPNLLGEVGVAGRGHKVSHALDRGALLQFMPALKIFTGLSGDRGAGLVVAGLRDPDELKAEAADVVVHHAQGRGQRVNRRPVNVDAQAIGGLDGGAAGLGK